MGIFQERRPELDSQATTRKDLSERDENLVSMSMNRKAFIIASIAAEDEFPLLDGNPTNQTSSPGWTGLLSPSSSPAPTLLGLANAASFPYFRYWKFKFGTLLPRDLPGYNTQLQDDTIMFRTYNRRHWETQGLNKLQAIHTRCVTSKTKHPQKKKESVSYAQKHH